MRESVRAGSVQGRLAALDLALARKSLDALLVTDETNVSYLTGFRGNDSALLLARDARYFITDFRYIEEARTSLGGFEIVETRGSMYEAIGDIVRKKKLKRMGFESKNVVYAVHRALRRALAGVRLAPLKDTVEILRQVKDPAELSLIKKAVTLARSIYARLMDSIEIGETEEGLAARIKTACIEKGASPAFDPIVAIDADASRPHAVPGRTKVKERCLLLVDWGVKANGYNTDMTRTTLFGRAGSTIRKMYDVVKKAQELAIKKVRPGVGASSVDAAARDYIAEHGFGKHFGHAVGHGVGQEVHEKPAIATHNHARLEAGMVFTIEPAIYVPALGGVRIEDMVVVTEGGCEVITGG